MAESKCVTRSGNHGISLGGQDHGLTIDELQRQIRLIKMWRAVKIFDALYMAGVFALMFYYVCVKFRGVALPLPDGTVYQGYAGVLAVLVFLNIVFYPGGHQKKE